MKKRHIVKPLTERVIKNPVAKYAHQFNKAQVFEDKTKYQRGTKHKGREPFIVSLNEGITKDCLFLSLFSLNATPANSGLILMGQLYFFQHKLKIIPLALSF